MIELLNFEEADIPRLIKWVPDARFLLQWAGPQYKYPLNAAQIRKTMEKAKGERPAHFMFKALHKFQGKIVGHIELMGVDYEKRTALLGRVLIGNPEDRGKGYGKVMIDDVARYAFDTLGLATLTLGVFDFNTAAITCYLAAGFAEYERKTNARRFGDEYWTLIMMKLDQETWEKERHQRTSRFNVPANG